MRQISIAFAALLFITSTASAQGYRGKDFWAAFPQNAIVEGDKHLSMSLYITAESRANGTITYLDSTTHFSVETGSSIEVDLDTNLEMLHSGAVSYTHLTLPTNREV